MGREQQRELAHGNRRATGTGNGTVQYNVAANPDRSVLER